MKKYYQKTAIFWYWFFGKNVKIESPVKSEQYNKSVEELLGRAFYFPIQENEEKINSPISGKIIKIFKSNGILIEGPCNLQIIITLKNLEGQKFSIIVKKGQFVHNGTNLFNIKNSNYSENSHAIVYVPWQPLLIKKIEENFIYFRNPFEKLNTKLHGAYL